MNSITIKKYGIKVRIVQTDTGYTVDGVTNYNDIESAISHAKKLIEEYATGKARTETTAVGETA